MNDAVVAEGAQSAENVQPTESEQPAESAEGTFGVSADEPKVEEPSSEDGAFAVALGQNEQDVAAAQNAENGAESQRSGDARVAKAGEIVTVTSAGGLPTTIEAGATVKLAANISLSSGKQIELVAGTLDGQGHNVELNGKALAKNVTDVVQNLGVTGQATMGDYKRYAFKTGYSPSCFLRSCAVIIWSSPLYLSSRVSTSLFISCTTSRGRATSMSFSMVA